MYIHTFFLGFSFFFFFFVFSFSFELNNVSINLVISNSLFLMEVGCSVKDVLDKASLLSFPCLACAVPLYVAQLPTFVTTF